MVVNIKNRNIFFHIAALCLIFISLSFLSLPAKADCNSAQLSGECSDGSSPVVSKNCSFGCCGICDPTNGYTGWVNPQAEVVYTPFGWSSTPWQMIVYKATMNLRECQWPGGARFCVRPVTAAAVGQSASDNYGNGTQFPAICAYEDSMDGMDTDPYSSPYAEHTSNTSAMSVSEAAEYGAIAGVIAGPFTPLTSGIGAAIGAGIAAILSYYNHVVITDIGCIPRKIGPSPPVWNNNAWFTNQAPLPTFTENPGSTFSSPKVDVSWCQDNSGNVTLCRLDPVCKDTQGNVIPCVCTDNSGAVVSCSTTGITRQSATLTLVDKPDLCNIKLSGLPSSAPPACSPSYQSGNICSRNMDPCSTFDAGSFSMKLASCACTQDPTSYIACKTLRMNDADTKFCAYIDRGHPDRIQFTMNAAAADDSQKILLGTFLKRSGYMPPPVVTAASGSTVTAVKVNVAVTDPTSGITRSIILEEDPKRGFNSSSINAIPPACDPSHNPAITTGCPTPGWTKQTGYISQIPFTLKRECLPGFMATATTSSIDAAAPGTEAATTPVGAQYCTKYSNRACVEGYTTPPFVIVDKTTDVPIAPAVDSINYNQEVQAGNSFPNKNPLATDTPVTSIVDGVSVVNIPKVVFTNPQSDDRTAYPDTTVRYAVNNSQPSNSQKVIRPLNPFEMGLCVNTGNTGSTLFDSPGSYTYTIPSRCKTLSIQAWGSGAGGRCVAGDDGHSCNEQGAGGEGAYAKWSVAVPSTTTSLNVVVGAGGSFSNNNNQNWGVNLSDGKSKAAGRDTTITDAGNSSNKLTAGGGGLVTNLSTGGTYSTNWSAATVDTSTSHNGLSGDCLPNGSAYENSNGPSTGSTYGGTSNIWMSGGNCTSTTPQGVTPPIAAGGCQNDQASDPGEASGGGNGYAIITCTEFNP